MNKNNFWITNSVANLHFLMFLSKELVGLNSKKKYIYREKFSSSDLSDRESPLAHSHSYKSTHIFYPNTRFLIICQYTYKQL